jgi:DNA-binding NtrC family response regulator
MISKHFILVVDDEPGIEKLMGIQLQMGGYECVSFHDPRKAMEFVVGNHDLLDLVILDMHMPGTTGLEMANEIFKIESALPVILITGIVGGQLTALTCSQLPTFKISQSADLTLSAG